MKKNPLSPGWFYRLSEFFKEKLAMKVIKIPVHAGLNCPNRDGTFSTRGCSYCYNPSFSPRHEETVQVKEQLQQALPGILKKNARGLAYFQTYSNTYGDAALLKKLYLEALSLEGIVGLSVSTRPDCLHDEILALLEQIAEKYHVWLELGLQTSHNKTLQHINRHHSVEQFQEAVERSRNRGFYICAHLILGLPGETVEDMSSTIKFANKLGLHGLKLHHLQVIRGTALEQEYKRGTVNTFSEEEYLHLVCDLLEITDPRLTMHRLMGEVRDNSFLIAPRWSWSKGTFYQMVEKELKKRASYQGALLQLYNQ